MSGTASSAKPGNNACTRPETRLAAAIGTKGFGAAALALQRTFNYPVFAAIRDNGTGFSRLAAVAAVSVPFGRGERAANLEGLLVSASYFPLLGVRAAAGLFFGEDEDVAAIGQPVAVISHAFWRRHFSGTASALGAMPLLGDRKFTVIGITPRYFTGLDHVAPTSGCPSSQAVPCSVSAGSGRRNRSSPGNQFCYRAVAWCRS